MKPEAEIGRYHSYKAIMTEASEAKILSHLSASADAVIDDTFPWSETEKLDHKAVVGAIKSLLVDGYIQVDNLSTSFYSMTKEGEAILANGSQEYSVLQALEESGALSLPDLEVKVGKAIAKIGMGNCMKKKWIKKDGGNLVALKKLSEVNDEVQEMLKKLRAADFSKDAISDQVSHT
jgi:phenylalanyl-tRNA synthetase alpha chain